MDEITLKDYRCFREEQTAHLAPLTLLVGENSTGKTSFMAMVRALYEIAHWDRIPNFKEEPYDLGSFDEIAHYRGGKAGRAKTFEAKFSFSPRATRGTSNEPCQFEATFGRRRRGTEPVPVRVRLSQGEVWVENRLEGQSWQSSSGTSRGTWESPVTFSSRSDADYDPFLPSLLYSRRHIEVPDEDRELIVELARSLYRHHPRSRHRPYASAPVRSKPLRTHNPSPSRRDSEGDYIPMYLADLYFREESRWKRLKGALEDFGRAAGLFDEISIKALGRRDSEPFQLHVRKFGGKLKGPSRNLIDVGYGVSQVLPVVTELLRQDAPPLFLLQQPEVHLHPSAQAALGSLFCQVASRNRQLIVETHSDNLIDRVRMDVRDGATKLKPKDVSILFFERGDLDVHIHSLQMDQEGNFSDPPRSYRRFFMEETARSLRL